MTIQLALRWAPDLTNRFRTSFRSLRLTKFLKRQAEIKSLHHIKLGDEEALSLFRKCAQLCWQSDMENYASRSFRPWIYSLFKTYYNFASWRGYTSISVSSICKRVESPLKPAILLISPVIPAPLHHLYHMEALEIHDYKLNERGNDLDCTLKNISWHHLPEEQLRPEIVSKVGRCREDASGRCGSAPLFLP